MRKLERNVPAAHEHDARWKAIELEKLFARQQVLRAGNSDCRRPGTGSHDDVPAFESVVSDRDLCRTRECRAAVKGVDASLRKPASRLLGTSAISERLNSTSRDRSICVFADSTPLPLNRRTHSTASAAPTRIFLGSQPRSEHVPPNGPESTTAIVQPAARASAKPPWTPQCPIR